MLRKIPIRWLIVGLLFLASVNNYLDRQTLSVLAPHMMEELGLTQVDYSFVVNAFLVAYAIMYAGSGRIIDLIGGRKGISICMMAWTVITVLHATVVGFLTLTLYRFFLGLTEPGLYTGASKIVSQLFTARERALAIGIVVGGVSVGATIAPPIVVWLMLNYGWRVAFLATGASGFVILILWQLVYSEATESRIAIVDDDAVRGQSRLSYRWRDLFRIPSVWVFLGMRVLGDPVWFLILFWLPDFLVKERGFSMAMIGKTVWIPFIGVDIGLILGGLIAGALISRGMGVLPVRKLMTIVAGVLVPFGIIASLKADNPYAIVSLLALSIFSFGFWMSTVHALPGDLFPFGNVASVYGLGGTAGAIGSVIFMTVVGILAERGLFEVAFIIAATMFLLSVLIFVVLMRPVKTTSNQPVS